MVDTMASGGRLHAGGGRVVTGTGGHAGARATVGRGRRAGARHRTVTGGDVGARRTGARLAPQEAVERGHGHRRVGAALGDRGGHPVDVLPGEEGAGALHEQDDVHAGAVQRLVGVQGVQHGRLGGGGVPGEVRGPQHDLGARLPRGLGDGRVVGGDDHVRDVPGGAALPYGAGHQGHAADGGEVLGGDALGAAACGDHG